MPIDLVYILGTGSNWNNNEIRFSIRSVEKNLKNYGNIYIIGENPGFLKNIIHIPYPDELGSKNADGNITRKLIRACKEKELSNVFIKMNDDYLIVKPIDAKDIKPLHKGELSKYSDEYFERNQWRKRLGRTKEILLQKNLPTKHFDYHAPLPINKNNFPKIVSQFDYENDIGYTTRSIYGNVAYPRAKRLTNEKITIFRHFTTSQLKEKTQTPTFVAYNDDGLNNPLKLFLHNMFPEPSTYETNDAVDLTIDVLAWENNGKNYEDAVRIFKTYFKKNNLTRLIEKDYNPILHRKFTFKLEQKLKNIKNEHT